MKQPVRERCRYVCGPYKGYLGRAEYDPEANLFHGEVIGTRDVITFQAAAPSELWAAFVGSLDDYLDFCRERGEQPEKSFSGRFVARIRPELHRRISLLARQRGTSLNAFVEHCLSKALEGTGRKVDKDNSRIRKAKPPRRSPSATSRRKRA